LWLKPDTFLFLPTDPKAKAMAAGGLSGVEKRTANGREKRGLDQLAP
jgi:hypothetical protein